MHRHSRADDRPAEHGANRLMAETDAENRCRLTHVPDHAHRHARFLGPARPRRDDDALGFRGHDIFERHDIVAHDLNARAKLAQVLHQVVGERIVIVDDQNHEITHGGNAVRPQGSKVS